MSKCENVLSRLWFLSQGCKQVPLEYTKNIVRWAHPDGYFLNAQGQIVAHNYAPSHQKEGNKNTHGGDYPKMRQAGGKACHILVALAFYGERPIDPTTGKPCVCHHLIPDRLDYRPANLLCWLTRAEHGEADRRQKLLAKVVPDGNLHLFTYERLRELQDPQTMTREAFEQELAILSRMDYHRVDPLAAAAEEPRKYC